MRTLSPPKTPSVNETTSSSSPFSGIHDEYAHLVEDYVVYSQADAATVGACLGYHVFLPSDRILNLYQKYAFRQFKRVCQLCKQIRVSGLVLSFNNQQQVLKQVSATRFPHLQILDVSGNNIESLEPLLQIETANLKILNLSANKITNIKCLTRIPYTCGCIIDLRKNLYNEVPEALSTENVQFDNRVVDKTRIYKILLTLVVVQQERSGRFLRDYFP